MRGEVAASPEQPLDGVDQTQSQQRGQHREDEFDLRAQHIESGIDLFVEGAELCFELFVKETGEI